jgi:predicted enzyme related to lactoylglutathione lyase
MSNTFHVALYVKDLDRAVAEYQKILGIAPAKVRPGYAKFELADPPCGGMTAGAECCPSA